jgi:hypothetical protein
MSTAVNKPAPAGNPAFPDFFVELSGNTPDFPLAQWVVNSPNLSALIGSGSAITPQIPKRYWIVDPVSSQNLREMTAPEKTAADTNPTTLAVERAQRKQALTSQAHALIESRYTAEQREEFTQIRQRAGGGQLVALNNFFDWLVAMYTVLGNALDAVDAASSVPLVQAVTANYTAPLAADPLLTLQAVV